MALTFIFKSLWDLNTSQSGTLPTLPLLALFVLCFYALTCFAGISPYQEWFNTQLIILTSTLVIGEDSRRFQPPGRCPLAQPKDRFPGWFSLGRSFSTYRVFFMTYAETGLMYENTAWSATGEKNPGDESACASKAVSDKSCQDSPANTKIVKLQSKLGRT